MSGTPPAATAAALRLLPAGSRGLLAEVAGTAEVLRLHAALRHPPLPGVVDLVPAARTVLVVLDPTRTSPAEVASRVRERWGRADRVEDQTDGPADGPAAGPSSGREDDATVVVDVRYDGADLAGTAGLLGLDAAGLVAVHTSTTWVVAFCGFAPGFPYCVAVDGPARDWQVPRRDEPRTRVPPGSVALAGPWTGVYPAASPGGWQLLGTTTASLWDTDRDPPALLPPGTRVRFVEVRP